MAADNILKELFVSHKINKIMKREMKVNLENCPIIAGMEPRYTPRNPTSGSFAIISGKESVDACTRV